LVTHSLEDLLTSASVKFGIQAKRLFTSQGGEIDDLKLLRDDDVLYVSEGEDFQGSSPHRPKKCSSEWIVLNVGGTCFSTTRSTLVAKEPSSMLSRMFGSGMTPANQDAQGAYLIDRSPQYFEPILNYLRHGKLVYNSNVSPEGLLEEARFYGVESLIPQLENLVSQMHRSRDLAPLGRRDVINALIITPFTTELRFQVEIVLHFFTLILQKISFFKIFSDIIAKSFLF